MSYYNPYSSNLVYHPGNMGMANPVCYPTGPQYMGQNNVGYGSVGYGYSGYHDPYYASRSSQFYDDGYFRNRYASYYDLYPESGYMGGYQDRFPTYLDYLRDRVRSYDTDYYPSRDRYNTGQGFYGPQNSGLHGSHYGGLGGSHYGGLGGSHYGGLGGSHYGGLGGSHYSGLYDSPSRMPRNSYSRGRSYDPYLSRSSRFI